MRAPSLPRLLPVNLVFYICSLTSVTTSLFCTSGSLFPVQLAEMYYMPRLRLVGATVTGTAVWQVKSVAGQQCGKDASQAVMPV